MRQSLPLISTAVKNEEYAPNDPAFAANLRRAFLAGLLYFAIVFAIGFLLGAVRTLLLSPSIGELPATLLEMPIILGASWLVCRWLLSQFNPKKSWSFRIIMGVSAFVFLMVAEIALSLLLMDRTLIEYLTFYRNLPQILGLIGQIAFAAFPVIQK